jgi:hypothetical protein
MEINMDTQVVDFLRQAVVRAITPLGSFDARQSQLRISQPGAEKQITILSQYVGGRHGCGWEQDGFWSRTLEAVSYPSLHGHFEVVKTSIGQMVEPICAMLEQEFAGAACLIVIIEYVVYPNYRQLPGLEGDSRSDRLHESLNNS